MTRKKGESKQILLAKQFFLDTSLITLTCYICTNLAQSDDKILASTYIHLEGTKEIFEFIIGVIT